MYSRIFNASFPYSDSDVAKYRVVLLCMGLFPLSESNSDSDIDITIAKYRMGSVPIYLAIALISITQWKQT